MPQTRFGGRHTDEKLAVLVKYLAAYATAMKHQRFQTLYIDAFAGTGDIPVASELGLFADVEEMTPYIAGSARRALLVQPPFGEYIFVEAAKKKSIELAGLSTEFINLRDRIYVEQRNANEALRQICQERDWRKTRAVVFLDPYGNQVDWETIALVAQTKAIDLWYLFPAGLGVHRQIGRDGTVRPEHAASLDRLLGTEAWRDEFIATTESRDLFGALEESSKQTDVDQITRFMIGRLKAVFAGGVLDSWLPLGRQGAHWYSLLFAWANPSMKASSLARKLGTAVMKRK